MNLLIDTNILLDVFWNRSPFVSDSAEILRKCETGEHNGFVSIISLANISYLGAKTANRGIVKQFVLTLLRFLDITKSDKNIALKAFMSNFKDMEDALQYFSAQNADAIITRDQIDFKESEIPVYLPSEFLSL